MKLKTTAKAIRTSGAELICAGYCSLESLLSYVEPFAYTCGVYGWNFDAYQFDVPGRGTVILSTGYRNMPGRDANNQGEYNARAREITRNWDMSHTERRAAVMALLDEFLAQA